MPSSGSSIIESFAHKFRFFCGFALSLWVLLGSGVSFAAERFVEKHILEDRNASWQITAEKMSYSREEGLYVARGNVNITRNGQTLYAKMGKYNEKTGIVEMTGGVRLEANGDVLTGERGIFDLNNHQGQLTRGSIFLKDNHYYISGDLMERTGPNTYKVTKCKVTTCDGEKPDWSVTGSEVEITIEGYGKVKHAAFRIRDVPVFYFPYAVFPAKSKRQSGLLIPRMGYSDRTGADMEIPFFWAISDQADATFYERYMSKRGLMQGLEFRYIADPESKGIFLADVLSDSKEQKDMNNPDDMGLSPFPRTNQTRYWFRGRADQNLPLEVKARFDGDFVSDQDYMREFRGGLFGLEARSDPARESHRPFEEIFSPTRRSALRLSRDGEAYGLQAITSYYQRPENPPDDHTPQPLAGMNFSLLPRPLPDLPLFLRLDTDYNYVWRDAGVKGHSLSFSPALSYPMWFGPFLEFEPTARFTSDTQWLDGDSTDIDRQTKNVYEIGGRLSTVLERTFDVAWQEVNRVKHKIFPSLSYTYRRHKDQDRFKPWFEPVDEEGDVNRITLSVENFFDVRKKNSEGEVTYNQWGTFSLSQGYDLHEAGRDTEPSREKQPFEPLAA
ncbi:MAG: LPS assembly protein LptD, partial [Pseudomonadota bacterium]